MGPISSACSPEWRQLVSCRADGELVEFDAARLDRHLAGCPACAAWADEVSSLTGLLRSDERTGGELALGPQLLRRGRTRASLVTASAASVAAAAVAAFALQLPLSPEAADSAHGGTGGARIDAAQRVLELPAFAGVAIQPRLERRVLLNPVRTA